jgi:hypothetical protein
VLQDFIKYTNFSDHDCAWTNITFYETILVLLHSQIHIVEFANYLTIKKLFGSCILKPWCLHYLRRFFSVNIYFCVELPYAASYKGRLMYQNHKYHLTLLLIQSHLYGCIVCRNSFEAHSFMVHSQSHNIMFLLSTFPFYIFFDNCLCNILYCACG